VVGRERWIKRSVMGIKEDRAWLDAAETGCLEKMSAALARGADPKAENHGGLGAMALALSHGNLACLNLALSACPEAARGPLGAKALGLAARTGQVDGAQALIDAGANVNWADARGRAPAMEVAGNLACLRLVIKAGARVDAQALDGTTALMRAVSSDATECVQELLRAGAPVNAQDKDGVSAAMKAASPSRLGCLLALLQAGADPNACDHWGHTLLMRAASMNSVDTVERLVKVGVSLDAQNHQGHTAAMLAAATGCEAALMVLMEAGANLELQNRLGRSVEDCAVENGHQRLAVEVSKERLKRAAASPNKQAGSGPRL
jgi:ankyrin repeat protein